LYGFLWNGRPFSSSVISESGLITVPGVLFTLRFDPSRYLIMKSQPVRASLRLMFFSKNKSAPFLLKSLCGYSLTTIITSPASFSGCSSLSPWKIYFSPCGEPLSIQHSITFFSFTTFFPLQFLHLSSSLMVVPYPLQLSQGPVDYEYIPGPS